RENAKRAEKIFDKKFLIETKDLILVHETVEQALSNHLFSILDHIMNGKIEKNKVGGVHYYNPEYHKIVRDTKKPNKDGIWEAKISIKNYKNNKWIEKEELSTFFPKNWDTTTLCFKLKEAFVTKEKQNGGIYIGNTSCGIKIAFYFKGSKILSVYPLYA
nr:EndoU domain-containing protein [Chitinophagaceae bacterium]